MSSKRRLRRRSCENKVTHQTRQAALYAAYIQKRRDGQYRNAYKCKFCGKWHIGRPPRQK